MSLMCINDTIVALSTPEGTGALGLIRLSGPMSIIVIDKLFRGRNLLTADSHHAYFGGLVDENGVVLDECVTTIFRGPHSFTGEHIVELTCHGSPYIIESIIQLLLRHRIRLAGPGEFTQRAFLNGKMDLSQAEAVGDLIAAQTSRQHRLAMTQMKGGVSIEIGKLRGQLIKFASLIELENDFGEEDVEFANREMLVQLVHKSIDDIQSLEYSFQFGQAIKNGIAVAIVGRPNVGKSTLLNALLNEDRAIVSDIPGTTRDVIEDTIQLGGLLFRFIDTAGIHETVDQIESIGIEKSLQQIEKANIILWMEEIQEDVQIHVANFNRLTLRADQKAIILLNKIDTFHKCQSYDVEEAVSTLTRRTPTLALSAKTNQHLDKLKELILEASQQSQFSGQQIIISNLRHLQSLVGTRQSLTRVKEGINNGIPSDLIAIDIRHALHHLGEIAGEISTDDLLESIFRDFCIGK